MASRRIEDLVPELQEKFRAFAERMEEKNLDFIVTCTFRSQEEQERLYAQGRTVPGRVVTWTRHSKHNEGKAFDIAIIKDGKPIWDPKIGYPEAGRIGEEVGLRWGGRWKNPDPPHFELMEEV